jgi:hypothetical protein
MATMPKKTKQTPKVKKTLHSEIALLLSKRKITSETLINVIEAIDQDAEYGTKGLETALMVLCQGDSDWGGALSKTLKHHEVKANKFADDLLKDDSEDLEMILEALEQ